MDKTIIKGLFKQVRDEEPLVHHITNDVTVNDCANSTLAMGGSPVMATSIDEVAEMVALANALVVNFGTIDGETYEAMVIAGKAANEKRIPVIVDPVGVGATTFRTEKMAAYLKEVNVAVIKGNISEIHAVMDGDSQTRGVDASEVTNVSQTDLAMRVANEFNTVVVISGELDIVCDGKRQTTIENGDAWLTKVTGTGCMTASLIGCFAGVTNDYFQAAVAGMSTMSFAGEYAKETMKEAEGLGTYRVRLMDMISHMDGKRWAEGVRLR